LDLEAILELDLVDLVDQQNLDAPEILSKPDRYPYIPFALLDLHGGIKSH
jgi:hypothetical protein